MADNLPEIGSGITWFYYDNFAQATVFYEAVLGLTSVVDQGWAKIYPLGNGGFLGAVDAQAGKGSCMTQPESAVLLTLVVDDVTAWHAHLKKRGVNGLTEIEQRDLVNEPLHAGGDVLQPGRREDAHEGGRVPEVRIQC